MIKAILFITLVAIFFKPTPTGLLGAEIGLKIPDLLYLLIFVWALVNTAIIPLRAGPIFILYALVISEFTSLINGALQNDIGLNDLIELMRPALFIMAAIFGSITFKWKNKLPSRKTYNLITILFFAVTFAIFFDPFGVKGVFGYIYELGKSRGISEINVNNIWRLSSTFTNPNYFGMFSSVLAGLYLYLFLNKSTIWNCFCFSVYSLFVLLSGSRTALIILLILFIVVLTLDLLLNGLNTRRKIYKYIFFILATGWFVGPFVFNLVVDNLWRFTNVDNIHLNLSARIEVWRDVLAEVAKNPLVGVGSNKSQFASVDNNYIYILYKNGVMGLFLYLGVLISALYYSWCILSKTGKKMRSENQSVVSSDHLLALVLFLSVIMLIIGMMSATPLFMVHLAIPFFILYGYVSVGAVHRYD